jgi:hypothetical protein
VSIGHLAQEREGVAVNDMNAAVNAVRGRKLVDNIKTMSVVGFELSDTGVLDREVGEGRRGGH